MSSVSVCPSRRFEVVILEPPCANQLETTVEQSGAWKTQDKYVVDRQTAYAGAVAEILGHGSFVGPTISTDQELQSLNRELLAGKDAFILPHGTLCGRHLIADLRLDESNFYGGLVAYPHEQTKVLFRRLLSNNACRPKGWNVEFTEACALFGLPGYAVFSEPDLRHAIHNILGKYQRARIKLATGADGLGQFVIEDPSAIDSIINQIASKGVLDRGACVEVDLSATTTVSVNTENVGPLSVGSIGVHRRDSSIHEAETEVGTDYLIARGGLSDIAFSLAEKNGWDLPFSAIVAKVQRLDRLIRHHLPYLLITRRTYQVIIGKDALGRQHIGVLEQCWRRGGSSANTLLAMKSFEQDERLKLVVCSQDNAYAGRLEPDHWVLSQRKGLPYVARVKQRYYETEAQCFAV